MCGSFYDYFYRLTQYMHTLFEFENNTFLAYIWFTISYALELLSW